MMQQHHEQIKPSDFNSRIQHSNSFKCTVTKKIGLEHQAFDFTVSKRCLAMNTHTHSVALQTDLVHALCGHLALDDECRRIFCRSV